MGEVVETIPGVIVSQHAGGGKASQFYLRGFNLDHGTDLATSLDGMPINLPTHAHGQGYTDLNLLIPKLIRDVDCKKGAYYAEVGDFGSAGDLSVKRTSGFPVLAAAAITAVCRWKFEPARVAGQPVAEEVEVPVRFQPRG